MKVNLIIIFLLCVVNSLYATTPDFSNDSTSVAFWGADGSDISDDTNAFNLAINYCKGSGYKTMFIPCGTYYISSSLADLNSSSNMVSVLGENAYSTVLNISGLATDQACFKSSGGSDHLTNAVISSLTFLGANEEYGIEIKGTSGVRVRDCKFNTLKCGIVFSNDNGTGTHTEFCVAEGCSFKSKAAVFYKRGNGDASFQGTGLAGCTMNNRPNDNTPMIIIGEETTPTIHLFNAPMDFQAWVNEDVDIIKGNVSSSSKITTYGTITMELFSANPTIANSVVPVYHHGDIISWSSSFSFGDICLVNWTATNSDGSINVSRKPFSVAKTLNSTSTTIGEITTTMQGSLVTVRLSANNYDYRYLLFITHNGYGSNGTVAELDNALKKNWAFLGAPDFSVNSSGHLVITNSSYGSTAVSGIFHVFPMGQRRPYYLKSGLISDSESDGTSNVRDEQHTLMVFPNPAKDKFYIQSSNYGDNEYKIFDMKGILRKHGVTGGGIQGVNISDLSFGNYIIVVSNKKDGTALTQRLVIAR